MATIARTASDDDDDDEEYRADHKRSIKFLRAAVHGKVNTEKLKIEDEDIKDFWDTSDPPNQ